MWSDYSEKWFLDVVTSFEREVELERRTIQRAIISGNSLPNDIYTLTDLEGTLYLIDCVRKYIKSCRGGDD